MGHSALLWVLSLTTATESLAHWRLRILEYDLEVMHRPDIVHQAPNALYRLDTKGSDTNALEDNIPTLCTYPAELVHFIDNDDKDEADDHPLQPRMTVVCAIS